MKLYKLVPTQTVVPVSLRYLIFTIIAILLTVSAEITLIYYLLKLIAPSITIYSVLIGRLVLLILQVSPSRLQIDNCSRVHDDA